MALYLSQLKVEKRGKQLLAIMDMPALIPQLHFLNLLIPGDGPNYTMRQLIQKSIRLNKMQNIEMAVILIIMATQTT